MRIHLIACQVLCRELSAAIAQTPNIVTVSWMPQGLHEFPGRLREALQAEIDRVEGQIAAGKFKFPPDCIALGYGLCSNGTAGLTARTRPLILPRTDDCIALFLGSQERYMEYFTQYPGTYWFNGGWLENALLPTPERHAAMREEFAALYGEDNADFLMESGAGWGWIKNYRTCGYISPTGYETPAWRQEAAGMAAFCGWELMEVSGSRLLLDGLLAGDWNGEFLCCPPGYTTRETGMADKLIAVNLSAAEKTTQE